MMLFRAVDFGCLLLFLASFILWNSSFVWNGACALSTTTSTNAAAADQRVRRRKNPALWRQDLLPQLGPSGTATTTRKLPQHPPQVMAPAGGWPQLQAAVRNGADAVYLGLSSFSARARAANFALDELPQAVAFCHAAAVKVYVAMNTLVFQQEWSEVVALVRACSRSKVDAVIVQDIGLTRLIQKIAPDLEIHASTQQTVTSADGVAFAATVGGARRVVVGRELSVQEIAQVSAAIAASDDDDDDDEATEIEAFVHGALCVSYSGQCFSSEAWGGRSANRGQCVSDMLIVRVM